MESVQEWAKQELAKSPRHYEWVKIKVGDREVNSFVVYPETKKKATAVVVIHEIFGLSDWVQRLTDELAEAGYIAIPPDLLSGQGPNKGGTSDVATLGNNAVGTAIRDLPPDQVTADLNAVADYVSKLPAANGKIAVGGFCWGRKQTTIIRRRWKCIRPIARRATPPGCVGRRCSQRSKFKQNENQTCVSEGDCPGDACGCEHFVANA